MYEMSNAALCSCCVTVVITGYNDRTPKTANEVKYVWHTPT